MDVKTNSKEKILFCTNVLEGMDLEDLLASEEVLTDGRVTDHPNRWIVLPLVDEKGGIQGEASSLAQEWNCGPHFLPERSTMSTFCTYLSPESATRIVVIGTHQKKLLEYQGGRLRKCHKLPFVPTKMYVKIFNA